MKAPLCPVPVFGVRPGQPAALYQPDERLQSVYGGETDMSWMFYFNDLMGNLMEALVIISYFRTVSGQEHEDGGTKLGGKEKNVKDFLENAVWHLNTL